jgi:hypothetical protein
MCLKEVTTKFRKHKLGYKIFHDRTLKNDKQKKPCFKTPFMPCSVPFGTWIDCRDFHKATETEIKSFGYYPGWHYYLTKKAAIKNLSYYKYIIKISVKDVICIGSSTSEWDAGVSYKIKLDKIIFKKETKKDFSERMRNILEKKSLDNLPLKLRRIFQLFNFNTPPTQITAVMFAKALDNVDTYSDVITVIDSFARDGYLFKYFTFLHRNLMADKYYLYDTDIGRRYRSFYQELIKSGINKTLVTKGSRIYIVTK